MLFLLEYNKKVLTKLAGGNAKLGCYGLAITIFTLGITRDYLYVLKSYYIDACY
jgi:phosphatidylethanolamine N-methyltransferase